MKSLVIGLVVIGTLSYAVHVGTIWRPQFNRDVVTVSGIAYYYNRICSKLCFSR